MWNYGVVRSFHNSQYSCFFFNHSSVKSITMCMYHQKKIRYWYGLFIMRIRASLTKVLFAFGHSLGYCTTLWLESVVTKPCQMFLAWCSCCIGCHEKTWQSMISLISSTIHKCSCAKVTSKGPQLVYPWDFPVSWCRGAYQHATKMRDLKCNLSI